MSEPRSVIIDATNMITKLWHANAGTCLKRFVERLEALRGLVHDGWLVTAWDVPGRTFRHDLYPGYKAKRRPAPDDLKLKRDMAQQVAMAYGRCVTSPGLEADDVLAILARDGMEAGRQVVLVSGDKDVRQCLVKGNVTICRDMQHFSEWRYSWYTCDTLMEEYGLFPHQWPSFQALVGDSSDNIKGCPGIGTKTALALLQMHGTLHNVLRCVDDLSVSRKQREALQAWSEALLVLDVVTLRDCGEIVDVARA